jgi:lysophospholipid acyltransferase (LPLAT)-like uncharacterized protein
MKFFRPVAAWFAAIAILLLRMSCRIRHHGDPRANLHAQKRPYVYSVLHAHQVTAIIDGEPGTGAMVSRSIDGGIIIPSLRARGIIPVRGSTNQKGQDNGGHTAFNALVNHVQGGNPAFLAVDGPRGPRNRIHKGVALLSEKTGAAVRNAIAVPTRRWFLTHTWDRLQIPKPFSTIHVYFGEPIFPQEGERVDHYRERIQQALNELELKHDPTEAKRSQAAKSTIVDPIERNMVT